MDTTLSATAGTHPQLVAELAQVGERLRLSTVQVRGPRRTAGAGSGVIWRKSGLIVTNAHVARGDRAIVELCDGRIFDADVTARDLRRDLAALTLRASDLTAAEIGDSAVLRAGELVIAVGCPWGLVGALSTGIVHAVGASGRGADRWVQADVRLAPGNSGGPLADARGRVIGINSMIAGGLALAVPSAAVELFLRTPEGRVTIGVTVRPVAVGLRRGPVLGLLVLDVTTGSAAHQAGLLAGDVLVGAGGRPFTSAGDLPAMLQEGGAGASVELDLVRGGTLVTTEVIPHENARGAKVA